MTDAERDLLLKIATATQLLITRDITGVNLDPVWQSDKGKLAIFTGLDKAKVDNQK